MKKGSLEPALVNMTKKMSVPATNLGKQEIAKEGRTEYGKKSSTGDMAPHTKSVKPKLTPGLKA